MQNTSRRGVLRGIGAAITSSAVMGISSAESIPLQKIRELEWDGEFQKAQKLMDQNDIWYSISRGTPPSNNLTVSPDRYGDPTEDSETNLTFSLKKLKIRQITILQFTTRRVLPHYPNGTTTSATRA